MSQLITTEEMQPSFAPVALFVYARPDHLAKTLAALRADPLAEKTNLHIFCDAARNSTAREGCKAVRSMVRKIVGFASVHIVERDVNLGLARSIIEGVTQLLSTHERIIVLEDDLVVSPHFLRYMNDALNLYAYDEKVACIHGYCYPVAAKLPETFFLRGADCWGWATWRRAWQHFRADGTALLSELESRNLEYEFDMDGQQGFTRMLRNQIAGRNNSWAIRWHASCFLNEKLTLYPGRSLVHNIGNDSTGTHSRTTNIFDQVLASTPICLNRQQLHQSEFARSAFIHYFRSTRGNFFLKAFRAFINKLLR